MVEPKKSQPSFDPEYEFSEYNHRRASDDIADEIKSAIISNKFRQGDRLPSERQMATQFKVSRFTVREALRLLEAKGLIVIRKGAKGGVFIQTASQDKIAAIIMDKLELEGIIPYHIIETRVVLECGIVKYATENASSEDLERIAGNLEETKQLIETGSIKNRSEFVFNVIDFHDLLAKATHIPFLIMFNRTIIEWSKRRLRYWNPNKKQQLSHYLEHKEIFNAIKNKDVKSGQKLMEKQIREMSAIIEKQIGK